MKDFKHKEGVYVPNIGIDYPTDDASKRLVEVKVEDSSKGRWQFDETYPYIDNSFSYKFNRLLNAAFQSIIVALYHRICLGLRIRGRDILRKYKKELKGGALTVCNHVWREDAVMVYHAVRRYYTMHMPVYAKHLNNPGFYWMLRFMGGVPVPESLAGMRGFNAAFDSFHEKGEWIHVFPEAVRWDCYSFIRPFHKGTFTMAYKYGCPVVPCVITYRERKGIFRLTGKKQLPLFTIRILEPVFPNKELNRKDAILDMVTRAHAEMVEAAGIVNNPWPAIHED